MNEFFKLIKMELSIFRLWRNWWVVFLPLFFLIILLTRDTALFSTFNLGLLLSFLLGGIWGMYCGMAILYYTISILPYGVFMSYPQATSRFGLGNAFRMILPLDPKKIYLAMVTAGNLVLLLAYLAATLIALAFRGTAVLDLVLYPFIFYCYAWGNYYALVVVRDFSKPTFKLGDILPPLAILFLITVIFYVADSVWNGAVLMIAGILTYVNCLHIWLHTSKQRPVPEEMVMAQILIMVLTVMIIATLNWNGHAIQSILQHTGAAR